jgi:hypothetical protein
MKGLVRISMSFAENFYLLHLAIVFFSAGEKLEQPGFEQLVRLGGGGKKLGSALA